MAEKRNYVLDDFGGDKLLTQPLWEANRLCLVKEDIRSCNLTLSWLIRTGVDPGG